jgi:hypothetical protein
MSSSYRNGDTLRRALALGLATVASTAAAPNVLAAQTYVVPRIETRVEYNDNFGLAPDGAIDADTDAYGFIVDAEALIGIATPRGETTVRPRLRAQEYPDVDDQVTTGERITPLEAFLDLRSTYKWQRSDLLVDARYSHQDSYNVETSSGVFDPLDPNYGSDPDSSRTRVGDTRDRFLISPTFTYALTERVSLGADANYQIVRYDSEGVTTRLDYDYAVLDGFATWKLSTLSDLTVGAYASKYETENDISTTDSYGGRVAYRYRWTESTGLRGELFYESSDITDTVPVRTEDSTSGWGGTLTAYRRLEVSDWRFTIGRRYIPTSDGRKAELDQFRLQYDRDLSPRLEFRGVARYETRSDIAPTIISDDRDFVRGDLSLRWMMTQQWFLSGGYSYIWEDRDRAISDASNNQFFIGIGYEGLAPQ